jgi:hypothetical protein
MDLHTDDPWMEIKLFFLDESDARGWDLDLQAREND